MAKKKEPEIQERPLTPVRYFYVAYGTSGKPETTRISHDGEMFKVRRGAMAVAKSSADAYLTAGNDEAAEMCNFIRMAFLECSVGSLMFGYAIEFEVAGTKRFIAVCPAGHKWEDVPTVDRVSTVDGARRIASHHSPVLSSAPAFVGPALGGEVSHPPARQTVAQKIGSRMAKAAREASEKS